jgi:hypothetical protein
MKRKYERKIYNRAQKCKRAKINMAVRKKHVRMPAERQ